MPTPYEELVEYIRDVTAPTVLVCAVGKGADIQAAIDSLGVSDRWIVQESAVLDDDKMYAFKVPRGMM